jgi:hypothetical protein
MGYEIAKRLNVIVDDVTVSIDRLYNVLNKLGIVFPENYIKFIT